MIDVDTSLELAIEEAFDENRICEQPNIACTEAAVWWRITGCCGAVHAKCRTHKYGVFDDGTPSGPNGRAGLFFCRSCRSVTMAGDHWEPIR